MSSHAVGAMVLLIAIAAAIMCLNDVFQIAAVLVATASPYVAAFGAIGALADADPSRASSCRLVSSLLRPCRRLKPPAAT